MLLRILRHTEFFKCFQGRKKPSPGSSPCYGEKVLILPISKMMLGIPLEAHCPGRPSDQVILLLKVQMEREKQKEKKEKLNWECESSFRTDAAYKTREARTKSNRELALPLL